MQQKRKVHWIGGHGALKIMNDWEDRYYKQVDENTTLHASLIASRRVANRYRSQVVKLEFELATIVRWKEALIDEADNLRKRQKEGGF
jgi:hypothetical protein